MSMYNCILASMLMLLSINLFSQDIIYCNDGRTMKTNVLKIESDYIGYNYFTDNNKVNYKIHKSEVIGIAYSSGLTRIFNNDSTGKLVHYLKGKLMPIEAKKQIIEKHHLPKIETRKINLGIDSNYVRIQRYKEFEAQSFMNLELENNRMKSAHLTPQGFKIAINGIQIDKAYGNPYIEVKVADLEFAKILEIVERPDTNVAMVQLNLLRKNITKSGEIFEIMNGEFTIYEYFVKNNEDWKIINKEIETPQKESSKNLNNQVLETPQNSNDNFKDKSVDRDKIIDIRKKEVIGKLIYNDGTIYEGELLNGHKHGKGIFTMQDNTIFKGEWRNDSMVGVATIISSNGSRFIGEVINNGIKNGEGKITFKDSSTFVGQFQDDEFYYGTFTNKSQNGVWLIYTGKFINNQLYNGTKATRLINCPKCDVIIAECINGIYGRDIAYRPYNYEKHLEIKEHETRLKPIKNRRVKFGLAISGGFNFASISKADPDIIDSFSVGYSPSLLMNIKLSKASSFEISTYYISKEFKFFNSGDNYEYKIEPQLSFDTYNAKMQFQELGISFKYLYRFIFIEGFINKVISAKRSGNIFYSDDLTGTQVSSDNYKYDFFNKNNYPVISGQKPMNEYIYGMSIGIEGKSNHLLLGLGYSLNLSNYFNKNYPLWSDEFNIDFYPTKDIDLKIGYLYLKMGYIFSL